jgi:hypothetical protein
MDYRPKRSRTGLILAIAITLVVVAGGAAGLYFGVVKKDHSGPTAAAGPFGDIDTLDPCGFVTADTFTDTKTDVHIQPTDLAECEVKLQLRDIKGGYTVDVAPSNHVADPADFADSAKYTVTAAGSLHIAKKSKESGSAFDQCIEAVYQDDLKGVMLYGSAVGDAVDSSGAARAGYDACKPVDEAVTAIVAAVSGHTLARIAYGPDSMGHMNLCSTVTATDIDAALNASDVRLLPRSTRAACYFPTAGLDGLPRVRVRGALSTPAMWSNGQFFGSILTTIAGRRTSVYSNSSSSVTGHIDTLCFAQTSIKTWNAWPGRIAFGGPIATARATDGDITAAAPRLIELASVEVTFPQGTSSDTCTLAAEKVAAKIWPQLPPTTS